MGCSEFASVGETGCMLVSKEAGYPKLVQQEVPEILSVMTCGIGSDIAKATFFVAFPDGLTASNVGRIRDVVPLDQQVRGNQGKGDKLPIVGPSSIPILG